jgi:hypothetical protein
MMQREGVVQPAASPGLLHRIDVEFQCSELSADYLGTGAEATPA